MSDKFHLSATLARPFVIGRSANCDLILKDAVVSRQHAQIYREQEQWIFADLGSSTGSWVGAQKIATLVLDHSMLIRIGLSDLLVQPAQGDIILTSIKRANSTVRLPWRSGVSYTVGRAADADICINHPQCPLHYATVSCSEPGVQIEMLNRRLWSAKRRLNLQPHSHQNLGWGTLHWQDDILQWIESPLGYSVQAHSLQCQVQGKTLLQGLNFQLHSGELLLVIGGSGQGKSTFLNTLRGRWPVAPQNLTINGQEVRCRATQQGVAFLQQHNPLRPYLTISETLDHQARLRLSPDFTLAERQTLIADYLQLMGLDLMPQSSIATLSGGEKRRVGLAHELMAQPGLLLLDEPFAGLDSVNSLHLAHWLRQISWRGYTMIITTHDLSAFSLADRIMALHQGQQAFYGSPDQALAYFNARSAEHILQKLPTKTGAEWDESFKKSRPGAPHFNPGTPSEFTSNRPQPRFYTYLQLTLTRFFKSLSRDRGRLAAMLSQPLIISLLFSLLFNPKSSAWVAAFALNMSTIWFALSLSIREIVAERELLQVELQGGASLGALLSGKILAVASVSLLQTSVCTGALYLILGTTFAWGPLLWGLNAGILAATTLGLAVSAAARNSHQANATLPLVLIPQLMFAGAMIPVDQMHHLGRILAQAMGSLHLQKALQNAFTSTATPLLNAVAPLLISLCFVIIAMLTLKKTSN